MVPSQPSSVWLNRYTWLTVLAVFFLIFVGAMVTSKDAGLSVPDWPLSYGSVNPPGWWYVENIRWEHSHRLVGTLIGLLTIGLAIGIWRQYSKCWVRWLGIAALIGVILQGLMGGLRVTQMSVTWAIIHGCFAQAFFSLIIFIAAITAPKLQKQTGLEASDKLSSLRRWISVLAGAIYFQLILGATMRHLKAGLAIPDFPLANGKLIPAFTNHGIIIHYTHRVWAVAVAVLIVTLLVKILRHFRKHTNILVPVLLITGLLFVQIWLGAMVIWSHKAPFPTTFHVMNGAAILGTSVYLWVQIFAMVPQGLLLASKKEKGTG